MPHLQPPQQVVSTAKPCTCQGWLLINTQHLSSKGWELPPIPPPRPICGTLPPHCIVAPLRSPWSLCCLLLELLHPLLGPKRELISIFNSSPLSASFFFFIPQRFYPHLIYNFHMENIQVCISSPFPFPEAHMHIYSVCKPYLITSTYPCFPLKNSKPQRQALHVPGLALATPHSGSIHARSCTHFCLQHLAAPATAASTRTPVRTEISPTPPLPVQRGGKGRRGSAGEGSGEGKGEGSHGREGRGKGRAEGERERKEGSQL